MEKGKLSYCRFPNFNTYVLTSIVISLTLRFWYQYILPSMTWSCLKINHLLTISQSMIGGVP